MFLDELNKPLTTKSIDKVLRENFGYEFPMSELTESKAKAVLEDLFIHIGNFRTSSQYYLGERNGVYLSMLATANYLTEYLRDKGVLLEDSRGITAGQALKKAEEAKDQFNAALNMILTDIAEKYLLNIGRQWASKYHNKTLKIDFSMGSMGITIDGVGLYNRQFDSSKWWRGVEKTLLVICGKYYALGTPRAMEVVDGKIYFRSNDTMRSVQKPNVKLRETSLLEAEPKRITDPTVYHKGIQRGLVHGVDTARKFVPHVAGSAIGAFMAGLRGQELSSDAGKVKITNLDAELEKHFNEYKDPKTQKVIKNYMTYLQKIASEPGKKMTPKIIEREMAGLPGNPFKSVTNPQKRQKLVDYFYSIYTTAQQEGKTGNKTRTTKPGAKVTQAMKDAASALENLGYPKKNAHEAIKTAVAKNPALNNNLDALIRASQAVITK
jgi:hypothetical protein